MNEYLSPKEDFRDWLIDNWFHVDDTLNFSISTYLQNNEFDKTDIVDRDDLTEFISDRLKEGLLNVIETYEETQNEQDDEKLQISRNKQLINLKKAIIKDATNRKEKIIAVDAKTFKDVYGKEVHLKMSTSVLESMKKDVEKQEVENESSIS